MFTDTLQDFPPIFFIFLLLYFFTAYVAVAFFCPLLLRNALDADEIYPWMAGKIAVAVRLRLLLRV